MLTPGRTSCDNGGMGHASREAGKSFEKRVQNALDAARQSGVVLWWTHQQPIMTMRGKPIGQSGADFSLLLRGGLGGAIEAKSVKGKRLMRDAIQPEQTRHLNIFAKAGCLALLAVEFRDEDSGIYSAHLVPWNLVPWEKARTAESVTRDAILDWTMRPDGSIAAMIRVCPSCNGVEPRGPIARGCCSGGIPF